MIKYADHDIDILFKEKNEIIKNHAIKIKEDGFQIGVTDGEHSLLYRGERIIDQIFNNIIKLSYRHYLCQNQDQYILYRFNDIGYEKTDENTPFIWMATVQFDGELDLKTLLAELSQTCPEEFVNISKLITPYSEGRYVSELHHFSAFVDDIYFNWAVLRVIMNNDFTTNDLDIKYGALASD
ncbi:MAG: hypothetical protein GY699_19835 [Desulfobacteraceae bacterium]|nr:hypothetical protein [Desulfobacteraceae bacterium]